jgi:aminoglycoside phosphotransferase (APT) family kinase protein
MDSITKTKLSEDQIIMLAKKAFGDDRIVKDIRELNDGFFNSGFVIGLEDGRKTVLKVSPMKDIKVMRYEKNIMDTEVFVLNKLNSIQGIPAPKVLFYDNSGELIESKYFFMEYIEGIPLSKIREKLTVEQYSSISSQVARCMKKINDINGDYFGCISQEEKRFTTWKEAFLYMINELLEDARDADVSLPFGYDRIYDLIYRQISILDEVHTPSLVHKDLWEGNIFIDPKTMEVNGIIDCERALFGDPLLDPVCAFTLDNKSFMKAYFGRTKLEWDEYIRSVLYKVYLFLLMVIECPYRQYPGENADEWARARLGESLDQLIDF